MADELGNIADHSGTARGRLFLFGGLIAGVLLILILYTHGFGLLGGGNAAAEAPLVERRGAALYVPEGSALRAHLGVEPVREVPLSPKLRVPGTIEPDPARSAAVLSPGTGRVVEVRARPGQRVNAGDVLLVIDSPDLAQAQDDDAKAAETLALARRNLTRAEGQTRIGAGSERDLDQARNDAAQAAADYARTQAHLRNFGAAARARTALLSVRAPFSGTVTALNVADGNMINDATQPVLTLVHTAAVWVTALVADRDLPRVTAGDEAEVSLDAYPQETLHGRVLSVSDVVENDSRRTKVRIAFDNPGNRLRPNGYASVTLVGTARGQLVLPTSALLMNNDRTSVFVRTAPWTFERRTVEVDLQQGDSVPVRSGLKAGDQVVVRGGILLND
ncbi:MAG: efflux RND transporter periplasmic adaptor subunit [Proteobacteria bacterium]|nr:efflux RND transporter periplasmic adaptor subunit [Pseudomonadota bacterium]